MTVSLEAGKYLSGNSDHEKRAEVMSVVTSEFGIPLDELQSSRRTAKIYWPRHVAAYLLRKHTNMSYPNIGKYLGNRDHSTVMNGDVRVKLRMQVDPAFTEHVHALEGKMRRPRIIAGIDAVEVVGKQGKPIRRAFAFTKNRQPHEPVTTPPLEKVYL